MNFFDSYTDYCRQLQKVQKFRTLPKCPTGKQKGLIDFSTNDYLGLSNHPALLEAAYRCAIQHGAGATGSRLLSGNRRIFEELETRIAQDKKTEAALIFNSGYQANATVLAALLDSKILGKKPLVFFDKLNHASLYHGVFLSGAELIRYHHNDFQDLENKLRAAQNEARPKFIVSETLFGMDGDVADIPRLIALAKTHEAFLYLDEAHATGVLGERGYGLSTLHDFKKIPHLIMGTFSKGLGVFGAYIACCHNLKEYLINKSTGFIYSTALSPMVIGAVQAAWELLPSLEEQRKLLEQRADDLRKNLQQRGFDTGASTTHIIPIILGTEEKTLQAKEKLLQKNILVSAIRPPTVPPSKSRLRLALTTKHSNEDIEKFLSAISEL
ncbi:MAG: 8-amino-7-oxononanoate synthase [bacterium]